MNNRVAFIRVVDFPLLVLVGQHTPISRNPYAVAEHEHPHASLVAVNRIAERDVQVGMTVAQARNRCAQLQVLVQDIKQERLESKKITALLRNVGPNVELAALGEYYLELRGLIRLYGSEANIGQSILRELSHTKYTVQVGIAGMKQVARIASLHTHPNGTLIISRGRECNFLAPLPIAALGFSTATNLQLYTLGIKTIGDIARLPISEVTRRFGKEVGNLSECMQNDREALVASGAFPQDHSAEQNFEDPIDNFDQLLDNISRLMQELLMHLQSSGQSCRAISLLLEGIYFQPKQVNVTLDRLTCSLSVWLPQVKLALLKLRFTSGVTSIRLTLTNVAPHDAKQMSLFANNTANNISLLASNSELEKLSLTRIAIINKVLPEESVISHTGRNGGLLDSEHSPHTPKCYYTGNSLSGLRLFKFPLGVEVTTVRDDVLGIVSEAGYERVVRQNMPCNVSGGWWEREFQRSYFEVETDRGMNYLLYHDQLQSKWYLQGIFD